MAFGPVGISYHVVIWLIFVWCAVYGDRAAFRMGAALAVSSTGAFTVAFTGNWDWFHLSLPLAALVAVTGRTMAALGVVLLYWFRILLLILQTKGYVSDGVAWEVNVGLLTLQMILATGAISGGLAAHSESSSFVVNMFRKYDGIANRSV